MEVYELKSKENLLYVYIKGKYFILAEQTIACSKSHMFPDFLNCVYLLSIWKCEVLWYSLLWSRDASIFVTKSPEQTRKPGEFYSPLIFLNFWTGEDKKGIKLMAETVKFLNFKIV